MSRFLFVVPPLAGHVNPTVSVGRTLMARGHDVAWTGHPEVVRALLPADAAFLPVDVAVPAEVVEAVASQPERGLHGAASLKFLWEEFLLPLGYSMVPGVHEAIDVFEPDIVVADQQAIAGAAVAEARGVRWATSATTSAELTNPLRTMPRVNGWIRELLAEFMVSTGVDGDAAMRDPRFSPHLVLIFSTPTLAGETQSFPDHYVFVGPSISDRSDDTPFDWGWLDPDRPFVLVTLGTLNWAVGTRFFGVAAQALSTLDVQAVMVGAPPLLGSRGEVRVAPRVPQLDLLARTSAVVCHAGHTTVCETLAHGIPLVVAPIRDDQPIVAQQVVAAAAGVRVKFGRVQTDRLRQAIVAALYDPILRSGAERVRRSFVLAGGPGAAADRLASLAPAPHHPTASTGST